MEVGTSPGAASEAETGEDPEEKPKRGREGGGRKGEVDWLERGPTFLGQAETEEEDDEEGLNEEEGNFLVGKVAKATEEAIVGEVPDALADGEVIPRVGEGEDNEEQDGRGEKGVELPEGLAWPEGQNQQGGQGEEEVEAEVGYLSSSLVAALRILNSS